MIVVLSDYMPGWVKMFEKEKELITGKFPVKDFRIEHIGSTAVPGLKAKPVIDMLIGLHRLPADMSPIVNCLESLHYQYIEKYNQVMPERRFFQKDADSIRTHQIHLVAVDSDFWNRHLFFRNYLRKNPVARLRYQELKTDLAKREWNSVNDYAEAKTSFIKSIEKLVNK